MFVNGDVKKPRYYCTFRSLHQEHAVLRDLDLLAECQEQDRQTDLWQTVICGVHTNFQNHLQITKRGLFQLLLVRVKFIKQQVSN